MESKNIKVLLIAIVITLAGSGLALGQDSVALSVAPSALRALETGGIAEGQELKIEGIVINQNDQSFTIRDAKGSETVVIVTKKTVIKKKRKGWFYGPRTSSADDIRCGLSLKVEGRGNSDGQLVAKNITIEEPDPKTAGNNQPPWTIQTVEHCGKCSSSCGEDCAASSYRARGCPGQSGCDQNK